MHPIIGVMSGAQLHARRGRRVPLLITIVATIGIVYEALLIFTSFLAPYRFPIPYAVPIFDVPFVLVATGVGYLCLERHRLRQDFQWRPSAWLSGSPRYSQSRTS